MGLTLLLGALLVLLSVPVVLSATARAQTDPVGTPGPIPGTVHCAVPDSECRQLNRDITCFYYGLRQGTTGWARCQAALADQGQSELRMLAQKQAQVEMQDLGNQLPQAGGWLQSINPGIAAPSIPQTLNCSPSAPQTTPADNMLLIPSPILESEANCPSFSWEGLFSHVAASWPCRL
jgi:hypothetical protein